MRKYRLSIYTSPEAKTIYEHEFSEIGQGLILAKEWGHDQWIKNRELKDIQWHIKLKECYTKKDVIRLVLGRFAMNGDLIICSIVEL